MNIVSKQSFSLKGNIKEEKIQEYVNNNPSVLGLGKLIPIQREVSQVSGGFLDILMQNEDADIRYEIEIQSGKTDPSHIIRTIEYWDNENKRNQKYKHIAVLIAEDITNRFFNVISLFNKAIPLIAIQMSAFKENGDEISIQFTKVIDLANGDDEDDIERVIADRKYWEKEASKSTLELVDKIFDSLFKDKQNIEKNYNKFYIGLLVDGVGKATINFVPKKSWLYIKFKSSQDDNIEKYFEDKGFDLKYDNIWRQYRVRVNNFFDYEKIKEIIEEKAKKLYEE